MSSKPAGSILSLSDHELGVEELTERDTPSQAKLSGGSSKKRKSDSSVFEISTDDDHMGKSSGSKQKKKRKKHMADKDLFDSDNMKI